MTKKIVILGAGKSSSYLIKYLYENRNKLDISLYVISDIYSDFLKHFEEINFIKIDIHDDKKIINIIKDSFILVSLLPPHLHYEIAKICSSIGVNMITASYIDKKIKSLNSSFKKSNSFLFMEMGLDPGIDHMSAMSIIDELNKKFKIIEFESYTGGLIRKDYNNPWGYKFTWNPTNVIYAGSDGAVYLKNGIKKKVLYQDIFNDISDININKQLKFEGYPNRDSLNYKSLYKLNHIQTLKRGTLRNIGFCKTWNLIVNLGLTSKKKLTETNKMTYYDFFNYNLKAKNFDELKIKLENEYGIKNNSKEFNNLNWSGFFSDKKFSIKEGKFADLLLCILKDKWTLEENDIDMIVMVHKFKFYENSKLKELISYMCIEGTDKIYTAMSKTVGLPIALLIELIITTNFKKVGIHLPFNKEIYQPLLKKLNKFGISFKEKIISI